MNSDYTTMIKTMCLPRSVPLMFLFLDLCDFPCVSVFMFDYQRTDCEMVFGSS